MPEVDLAPMIRAIVSLTATDLITLILGVAGILLGARSLARDRQLAETSREALALAREAKSDALRVGESQIEMNRAMRSADVRIFNGEASIIDDDVVARFAKEYEEEYEEPFTEEVRKEEDLTEGAALVKLALVNEGLHAAYDVRVKYEDKIWVWSNAGATKCQTSKEAFTDCIEPADTDDVNFTVSREQFGGVCGPWTVEVTISYRDGRGRHRKRSSLQFQKFGCSESDYAFGDYIKEFGVEDLMPPGESTHGEGLPSDGSRLNPASDTSRQSRPR